jgi:4-hydroxy-tetrahydrodipicolinate synthase
MATNTYTALITPFSQNKLDIDSFVKIIETQINSGIDGIVPCGTTGESPTLSSDEHNMLIEISVATAKNKIKIMAGTGSNSTAEAIEFTKHAKKIGVDSCLVVAPYYNKPTPEGIYQHFSALNKLDIPLIIYNIPGRSVINISDVLIAKLAQLENIIGIKDATGDLLRIASLRKLINKDFLYLSGEDGTALGFNAMGGNGIISVTSNIAPKLVAQLQQATASNNYLEALKIQDKLTNLNSAMFCETNPGPVKYACSLLGLCKPEIRLPLVLPTLESQQKIQQEMKNLNLI